MGGVCLTTEATERSVGIVGAVASGAGESLKLPLEPATRLNAIAIEAASNVVAHAYPGSSGPFELEITSGGVQADDLTVVVRDSGEGFLNGVGDGEAPGPGLGLAVICALADEIEIRSAPAGGTSLAARIRPSRDEPHDELDAPPPDTDPRSGGTLSFFGGTFVESVLPRTLAALVAGSTTAIDALTSVLHIGDAVAYGLRSVNGGDRSASVCWDGDTPREVRIGPMSRGIVADLVAAVTAVEPRSRAWLDTERSPGASDEYALVGLPRG